MHTISTKVIAISGASGAGKTTVVNELAKLFNCPSLLFDDHVEHNTYPENMKAWYEEGADVSQIKTVTMLSKLDALLEDEPKFIFIEEPFGRQRACIGPKVDYVVLLDIPLELCLARIIQRNIEQSVKFSTHSIKSYLSKYEDHLREIYQGCVQSVRNNCDLIINSKGSVTSIVNEIISELPTG